MHQRRGVLRTPSNIYDGGFWKNSHQSLSVVNYFCKKIPSQKSGRVPHSCYKIVVTKFPIYKFKQKSAKKVKN